MVGHAALGAHQSHLIPLPSLHGGEGSSFPGLVPLGGTVDSESVVGVKPGNSGVVIVYQVDEFTHTWSTEWLLLVHIFTLGSWIRCHHLTTSHLMRVLGLFISRSTSCRL